MSYLEETELAYNENYNIIYPWIVDGFLTSIIPFLLLLLLNGRLIWEVHKSSQYLKRNMMVQSSTNHVQREERQITIMLICVVIVFFICQAPYVIYTAINSIHRFAHTPGRMLFRYITMLLLTLKSAVNFVMYSCFSEKFRNTLRKMLCSKKFTRRAHNDRRKSSNYSMTRSTNYTQYTTV